MSDRYRVQFGALDQGAAAINKAVSEMRAKLDELNGVVGQTISTWDGASREAYYERQREWDKAAAQIETVLHGSKKAVDDSNAGAQSTEQACAGYFR